MLARKRRLTSAAAAASFSSLVHCCDAGRQGSLGHGGQRGRATHLGFAYEGGEAQQRVAQPHGAGGVCSETGLVGADKHFHTGVRV